MIAQKKILILGGGGFIGSAIAERYIQTNEVVITDIVPFAASIPYQRKMKNIKYVQMSATNREQVLSLELDYDFIVHATAILGIQKVSEESILTINTNYLSCLYALELATKQKKLEKFLTFSTSEVYGQQTFNAREIDAAVIGTPDTARWCYAASKVLSEHLVYAYHRERGLPTIIIRPFNVYGEYRMGTNAISCMVINALNNKPVIIQGNGKQTRVWCYINDFINGVIRALESNYEGESFNLGNPNEEYSIYDLAHKIIKLTNSKSKIIVTHSTESDVYQRTVNIDKAKHMLNYDPNIALEVGLVRYIDWAKTLHPLLRG